MRIYNQWAGNPNGVKEDIHHCIVKVAKGGKSCLFHQCFRSRGYGLKGEFCKQHAKQLEEGKTVWIPKDE